MQDNKSTHAEGDPAAIQRHEATLLIDPRALREAFGHFATGVGIIGARTEDGERLGATVNSFTSVSLDPPLVLVCLGHFMRSHDAFVKTKGFSVSLLSHDQEELSSRFARVGADKWKDVGVQQGAAGGLIITPSLAHFDCITYETQVIGDHTILIGRVVSFASDRAIRPLLFFQGRYGNLSA